MGDEATNNKIKHRKDNAKGNNIKQIGREITVKKREKRKRKKNSHGFLLFNLLLLNQSLFRDATIYILD